MQHLIVLRPMKRLNIRAPMGAFSQTLDAQRVCSALDQSPQDGNVPVLTPRPPCSLLHPGAVVRTPRLDDFGTRGAGLVVLVAVVGGRAVAAALVVADVYDHAGGGGGGSVELVLVP